MNVLSAPIPIAQDFMEAVVRLVPARIAPERVYTKRSGDATQTYDALIYAEQPLFPEDESPPILPRSEPDSVGGLPLLASGQIRVRWSHYREFLDAFQEGDKAGYLMRERLMEMMSGGLRALFAGELITNALLRVWWSVQSPELFDLPWELAAVSQANQRQNQLSFVRGTPNEWAPPVPLQGPLRLALIGSGIPPALESALSNLPPTIMVERMEGDPRLAIQQAVRQGFEMVHLVSDAFYTPAAEGILNFDPGATYAQQPATKVSYAARPVGQMSGAELSSLLRGSRVTLLSLSSRIPEPSQSDAVPLVYRAFAYLGHAHLPLPNLITQLGPIRDHANGAFWHAFYSNLGDLHSIEYAMMAGRQASPDLPLALFLRDRLTRQFRHIGAEKAAANPQIVANSTGIASELRIARDVLEQLRAVDAQYAGQTGNITDSPIYSEATAQLDQVEADLVDLAKE